MSVWTSVSVSGAVVVTLKGGASGAEALIYMKSSPGDANKILIAYSLIYMLPLSAKIPFNWRELTPVSLIALDQFVLWVTPELTMSPLRMAVTATDTAGASRKWGDGHVTRRLTVERDDETGSLASSFNNFLDNLKEIVVRIGKNANDVAASADQLNGTAGNIAYNLVLLGESPSMSIR